MTLEVLIDNNRFTVPGGAVKYVVDEILAKRINVEQEDI